jgi:hypothetical protein
VFQIVDFSSVNDFKYTYVYLHCNFFGVIPPTPVIKGRGGEGRGMEGREGREGMNPKTNSVYCPVRGHLLHFLFCLKQLLNKKPGLFTC